MAVLARAFRAAAGVLFFMLFLLLVVGTFFSAGMIFAVSLLHGVVFVVIVFILRVAIFYCEAGEWDPVQKGGFSRSSNHCTRVNI